MNFASLLLAVPMMARPVSLETDGESVKAFADRLSRASGAKIVAGPSVRNQILVAQIHEQPLEETLNRVARVLGASWQEKGGEITIFRRDEQEKAQATAELRAKIDAIRKWRDMPLPKPITESEARSLVIRAEASTRDFGLHRDQQKHFEEMSALMKQSPANLAAQTVRGDLDLNTIATVGRGRRYTFSSSPNRLQLPLRNGEKAIDRYLREIDLMRGACEASLERVPLSETTMDVRRWPDLVRSRPDRILLAAYRLPATPQILIRTYFVKGKLIVGWVSDSIDPSPVAKIPLPPADFEVDEDTARRSQSRMRMAWIPLDRPLIEKKVEPAAWVIGPLMRAYARARHKDLIACVPDDATNLSLLQNIEKKPLPILDRLCNRFMKWSEDDSGLLFEPDRPHEQRTQSMNRDAFWRLADSFIKSGKPTLTEAAEYLAQESVEPTCSSVLTRMTLVTTSVGWDFSYWAVAPVLRFWGSLPPRQREGTIAMSQVTGNARRALNEWVFGTNLGLQALEIDESDPEDGAGIARVEATERLPNGFPDDMTLTAKIESLSVIWQQSGDVRWASRMADAYPVLKPSEGPARPVALGSQRVLNMQFSAVKPMKLQVEEATSIADLKWIKVEELPADILAQLKEFAAKAKAGETRAKGTPPPVQ